MKTRLPLLLSLVLACGTWGHAEAPVPITNEIAPVNEITLEIEAQRERIEKLLESEESFQEQQETQMRQAFGLLAVLGQALAEHEQQDESPINGAALRDAALGYKADTSYEQAQEMLKSVVSVLEGNVTGEHQTAYPWNKLIRMHPMMEEINTRQSSILRVLRRPRGNPQESMHATTWVLLGLAMKADTHEVKDPNDLPQWNAWSDEFHQGAVKLGDAIRKKDAKAARPFFDQAVGTCDECHGMFQ